MTSDRTPEENSAAYESPITFRDSRLAQQLAESKSRFIRDRVRETAWRDRAYIGDLVFMESVILDHGPHSFGGGMAFAYAKRRLPVEHDCLMRELRDNVYTPPEEFHNLVASQRRLSLVTQQIEQFEEEAKTQEGAHQLSAVWEQMGGTPHQPCPE